MSSYFARYKWYVAVGVLALGAVLFAMIVRKNGALEETLVVHPGEFTRDVSVSGKVVPTETFNLSFEQSGTVTVMSADVGERVSAGQVLASQDTTQLTAQLTEMQAGVDVQKAKLRQLLAGASEEDIRVAETAVVNANASVASARQSVADAKQDMVDKLRDAYTKADDALRGKVDSLFSNPKGNDPQLSVNTFVGGQLETDVEWGRFLLEKTFSLWVVELQNISLASDLPLAVTHTKSHLNEVSSFLDSISAVVNSLYTNSNLTQATIDKWRTDVGTARTNVNTAIANLTAAQTSLKTEEAALITAEGNAQTAQDKLALAKAPARPADIAVYEAQIRQAEASAQNILAQLGKRQIRAPINGVITSVPAKTGSSVVAHETVLSLISADTLQIESYVPEVHISLIEIGDSATVVLDAYGTETPFPANVVFIDPAETVRDGVSTYRVKLQFLDRNDRIKSGMTTNIVITTEKKSGVISVPQGIVTARNGKKYIRVQEGTDVREREVTTGSVSSLGTIEIMSGLQDGDVVVLSAAE